MKVTRTILADVPPQLAAICKMTGYIRADIWRRYGALGNVGVSASTVRTEIVKRNNTKNNTKNKTKTNMTRKKIDDRQERTQKRVRTMAYLAAHSIVDKAAIVASESLTAVIASKHQWRRFNRRMSAWSKGFLAQAMDSVCKQRNAKHTPGNGAYTSPMDSTNGLLAGKCEGKCEGKRQGDKLCRANGRVHTIVLARLDDGEVSHCTASHCTASHCTAFKAVRRILLSRSPAQLSVKGLELGAQARQPSADKSYAPMCATF